MSDKDDSKKYSNVGVFKIFLPEREKGENGRPNFKGKVIGGYEIFGYDRRSLEGDGNQAFEEGIKGYINYRSKDANGNWVEDSANGIKVVIYPSNFTHLPTKIYELEKDADSGETRKIEVARFFHRTHTDAGIEITDRKGNPTTMLNGTYVSKDDSREFRKEKDELLDEYAETGMERSMRELKKYDSDSFFYLKRKENKMFSSGEKLSGAVINGSELFTNNFYDNLIRLKDLIMDSSAREESKTLSNGKESSMFEIKTRAKLSQLVKGFCDEVKSSFEDKTKKGGKKFYKATDEDIQSCTRFSLIQNIDDLVTRGRIGQDGSDFPFLSRSELNNIIDKVAPEPESVKDKKASDNNFYDILIELKYSIMDGPGKDEVKTLSNGKELSMFEFETRVKLSQLVNDLCDEVKSNTASEDVQRVTRQKLIKNMHDLVRRGFIGENDSDFPFLTKDELKNIINKTAAPKQENQELKAS